MGIRSTRHDVAIVGGGIAGAALAASLARSGIDVLLLEASERYFDRVRGEALVQWGVAEAQRLGLLDTLLDAGGHYVERMLGYDEVVTPEAVESAPVDMGQFVPGVPGILTITHPEHCQALLDAAKRAGATIERGVQVTSARAGTRPGVEFRRADEQFNVDANLVVGADGRSSMMHNSFGIHLDAGKPPIIFAGLLVEGAVGWNSSAWSVGTEGRLTFAIFPMDQGRARVYAALPIEERQRFSGPDAVKNFLASFDLTCCPASRSIALASPAGPLMSFLDNESWVDEPMVDGGVLIGDAGGWTDPIIGCGLSSAYRDARIVFEILTASRDWSRSAFEPYAKERKERLRRLRSISAISRGLLCEYGEQGRSRRQRWFEQSPTDPTLLAHLAANLAGPENQPAEIFTDQHRAHVLNEAGV